jgi:hypothetical protein
VQERQIAEDVEPRNRREQLAADQAVEQRAGGGVVGVQFGDDQLDPLVVPFVQKESLRSGESNHLVPGRRDPA